MPRGEKEAHLFSVPLDWDAFLVRLGAYPTGLHGVLPPCPDERIEAVEKEIGTLPTTLKEMLRRFNGAELFRCPDPFVSLFRISSIPPLPPLEWAPEWCVDTFTRRWRAAGCDRQEDWAIAMTNYGGLVLLCASGTVKEWDTGESRWLVRDMDLREWLDKIVSEGEIIMAE
jgi:hypothetical protein